ncbi:DinB family protein [Xylanibacillus composti]|uniref:DinB family protein n=1 Tax=Xylanibacillus composti TaxID=1572762 RepID=UPI0028F610A4|nr:DinB family protein [Xylanibacillus composti]MDT9727137.1 DinB family protein [Xylanibacillus composti]
MNEESRLFIIISKHRMVSHYLPKFQSCLGVLSDHLLWLEESENQNSIGGIILHVLEHIRRNMERYLDPGVKFTSGIEKLFPNDSFGPDELKERAYEVFQYWQKALDGSDKDSIDLYSLYHLIEHTGYHLGQVVDRTQRLVGVKFDFVHAGINEKNLKIIVERELEEGTNIR